MPFISHRFIVTCQQLPRMEDRCPPAGRGVTGPQQHLHAFHTGQVLISLAGSCTSEPQLCSLHVCTESLHTSSTLPGQQAQQLFLQVVHLHLLHLQEPEQVLELPLGQGPGSGSMSSRDAPGEGEFASPSNWMFNGVLKYLDFLNLGEKYLKLGDL